MTNDVRNTVARLESQTTHVVPILKNWIGVLLFASLTYLTYLEDPKIFYIAVGLGVLTVVVTLNAIVVTRREYRHLGT